jgi:hypothetical protein
MSRPLITYRHQLTPAEIQSSLSVAINNHPVDHQRALAALLASLPGSIIASPPWVSL